MNPTNPSAGPALANAVASRLEAGHILANSHPEYCGIGLQYVKGVFVCAEVYDGELISENQYRQSTARGEEAEFLAFSSRAEFVAWLAAQSDDSLSGRLLSREWSRGNQRLTLDRLRAFAA